MAKTSEKSSKRFRKYAIQRNYNFEIHDKSGNVVSSETETEWRERLIHEWSDLGALKAENIAFIFHDKDVNSDGTSKGLHAHAVISFRESVPQSNAMKLTGCSSSQNCTGVKNKTNAYRYLIHVSEDALNKCKHIYSPADVICLSASDTGLDFLKCMSRSKSKEDEEEEATAVVECLKEVLTGKACSSEIRSRYLNDTYGCGWNLDFWYKHKSKYELAEKEWFQEMQKFYQVNNRCLTNIFITGCGGLGKSTLGECLATEFADSRGVHKPASPGEKTTFDFAGDYVGERVTLFNEFSASFPVEQFLDVFDPIRATNVNSRNSDKPWFADYGIFTTSRTMEQFIYDMWISYARSHIDLDKTKYKNLQSNQEWLHAWETSSFEVADKIRQIRRRFAVLVRLEQGRALVFVRVDANNVPHIFLYDNPNAGQEPFQLVQEMPFDVNQACDLKNLVKLVKLAIANYYEINHYSITPKTVKKPVILL